MEYQQFHCEDPFITLHMALIWLKCCWNDSKIPTNHQNSTIIQMASSWFTVCFMHVCSIKFFYEIHKKTWLILMKHFLLGNMIATYYQQRKPYSVYFLIKIAPGEKKCLLRNIDSTVFPMRQNKWNNGNHLFLWYCKIMHVYMCLSVRSTL